MSPAAVALAPSARRLPPARIEALARLMEAGAIRGDPVSAARVAASVALSHLAGACMEHLPRLTLADWRPDGRQVVVLDPADFYPARRAALARCVSVPDAAVVVVERYLQMRGRGGGPGAPLLSKEDGTALSAATPLRKALGRACVALGLDPAATTFGSARGLYCQAISGLEREDGLYEYMCGIGRSTSGGSLYSQSAPPPDAVMAAAAAAALPLAAPWRRLASPRGPSWSWSRNAGGGPATDWYPDTATR